MRETLEKKFTNNNITEEELNKYKKSILIKKILLEVLYIFMIIFSLIRANKNAIFYNVIGNGAFFSFYGIALFLFFLTLYGVFVYNTFILVYILIKIIKKDDYIGLIHKLNIKADLPLFIGKCLSILLFLLIYISTPCTVVGKSMSSTFEDGDKIFCFDLYYSPKKEDVIVFDANNYTHNDTFYIKRIKATEGMVIRYDVDLEMCFIEDEECPDIQLSDFNRINESIEGEHEYEFVIPKDSILVLGDNRNESLDSRLFGLVNKKDILGKVYFRILPFSGIRFF